MNISSRFNHFISQIRPSREQLEAADQQVAFLRKELTGRIAADKQFHLEKIFRSGSAAKHTDLARTGKDRFDIDLGIYYRAEGRTEEQLSKLLAYTRTQLREIYPAEKLVQDFHPGKNAVNITFHTSKLKVDVVPIIRDGSLKRNYGWIPRLDKWRLTSIPAHIRFIHKRTACSKLIPGPVKFNHLVRLMKYWNRQLPDNLKQCSYFCELITAAALKDCGVTNTWQSSLYTIFAFLSQHAFARL
jgi:Second Messenger Oligonucleotide or Dinucleotide Synthetase domain